MRKVIDHYTGGTVGLAGWIIDGTQNVLYFADNMCKVSGLAPDLAT